MDVICDTNIWYNIGSGSLKRSQLPSGDLVATFYNFEELTTSPNLVSNFKLVRSASKAIVEHSSKQILENAFLYIARTIDSQFEDRTYTYNLGIRNWAEVKAIARQPDTFTLTSTHLKEYNENIKNRQARGEAVAKIENRFVANVKSHSRQVRKTSEQKYFKERFKGIVHELNEYLRLFSQGRLTIHASKLKEFELFLTAALQFARNVEISKWVVKPNDIYDLYNLVYVRPVINTLQWRAVG